MITADDARNQQLDHRLMSLVALYESAISEAVSHKQTEVFVRQSLIQEIIVTAKDHDTLMQQVVSEFTSEARGFSVAVHPGKVVYQGQRNNRVTSGKIGFIVISWGQIS